MATTSQIRQLQTPDNLVDVYPLTLEEAVFDDNGVQLTTKIHNLENRPLWNPKGTCTFANLPALSTAQVGDLWNISDQFTTTSDFHEGAGILVPAGSNVYKTSDGKWDILTGSAVVGVKGNAEQNYRIGNVNITLQNLGYDVENDLLATVPGYVLDARQGRVISGSILSISGRVDQTLSDIAPVEPSATSTRTYTVGKYLVYNDKFCKVIQAIAIGDTLTVGTNIEETKVVNEMGSGGSSGGGHTILNTSGTAMAQRSNLQFDGLEVTDDSASDTTTVSAEKIQHQLTDQTNVLGAKNLLIQPYPNFKNATTSSGITYIINSDYSITANGTGTGNAEIAICGRPSGTNYSYSLLLPVGKYIYSGRPNVENRNIDIYVGRTVNNAYSRLAGTTTGTEFEFEITSDMLDYGDYCGLGVYINIRNSQTVSNLTFKPMLRLASDPDDTYVPNAMTNRELTEEISNSNRRIRKDITSQLTNLSTAVAAQDLGKYGYTIGDYFTGASGYTYVLADLNPFKGTSTPYCITSNHLGIVVDTHATTQWHTDAASSVGYNGSTYHAYLKNTVLPNVKNDIAALFGDWNNHLLSHSKLLTTALANWAWQADQYISALTCTQVDGGSQWTANGYQEGEASKSLAAFRKYKWTEIFGNEYVWLRNISNNDSSAGYACNAGNRSDLYGGHGVTFACYAAGLIIFY